MKRILSRSGCALFILSLSATSAWSAPRMLAYSAQPNGYFNDHAAEVARIYDGFFFVIGTWDEGVAANIGVGEATPATTAWKELVRENLKNLRAAGATESLLGVCFSDSGAWPSPRTLLSKEYQARFQRYFAALGKAARELGFRGVSIDVEYPYPRYELDHEIYKYENYSAEDLIRAASLEGRIAMSALLDEFPDAVIFSLPGDLGGRTLGQAFVQGTLEVMAERDAPGGCHMASERAYSLLDPLSQVAIPRVADCMAPVLLNPKVADYWKRRCTVAPGVWPLHMVETGGKDYPKRPWVEELAELDTQMKILRLTAKQYIWSFSCQPIWYQHTPELEARYGLTRQTFEGVEQVVPGWHKILSNEDVTQDPDLLRLIGHVDAFDRGEINACDLCARFGTPGDWLVMGPFGNLANNPAFFTELPLAQPLRPDTAYPGRDGAVRWFPFPNREPLGSVRIVSAFGERNTDQASALLACWVHAKEPMAGFLNIGWDDGIIVRLGKEIVFDRRDYPPRGHGSFWKDRYDFEEHVPVIIPAGRTLLGVTSLNSHGKWDFNLRFTNEKGLPLEGITFSTEMEPVP